MTNNAFPSNHIFSVVSPFSWCSMLYTAMLRSTFPLSHQYLSTSPPPGCPSSLTSTSSSAPSLQASGSALRTSMMNASLVRAVSWNKCLYFFIDSGHATSPSSDGIVVELEKTSCRVAICHVPTITRRKAFTSIVAFIHELEVVLSVSLRITAAHKC